MSDIKKTALIILIIALLSNTFTQYAYAANDYNHAELLEYEGYGNAMYESIVEQTTFISGQYTENKDYVSQSIDQILDYANTWKNDFNNWDESCNNDFIGCMRGMLEGVGGYGLTVGDFVKKLFTDYDATLPPSDEIDYSFFENALTWKSPQRLEVNEGWIAEVSAPNGRIYTVGPKEQFFPTLIYGSAYNYEIYVGSASVWQGPKHYVSDEDIQKEVASYLSKNGTVGGLVGVLFELGASVSLKQNDEDRPFNPQPRPRPTRDIVDYIQNNPVSVVTPQLQPRLVCPDGTTIQMNISGSTFLSVDGTVMFVNKDGTAQVSGQLCNLNWQKPTVDYNPDGEPVVTQPDGTKTNLDTGDTTTKPPGADDLEGCTGVLCGIGKLLDGLGSVVSSITGMVKSLLDGLVGLFVPDDLAFISEEFSRITDKLNEKIAITDSLKDAITSLFDGGGSNPLSDISINLPITNEPLQFGNVSFIEEGVPILRKVISAIVVLYTIVYVYRKITGRGGVMER